MKQDPDFYIVVRGGLVQSVIEGGMFIHGIEIRDYDIEGCSEDELITDEDGDQYVQRST